MKLIRGSDLTPTQRQEVLSAFTYRFINHEIYPVNEPVMQRNSHDGEWLSKYAFYIREDGHLANRPNYCVPVAMMEDDHA